MADIHDAMIAAAYASCRPGAGAASVPHHHHQHQHTTGPPSLATKRYVIPDYSLQQNKDYVIGDTTGGGGSEFLPIMHQV